MESSLFFRHRPGSSPLHRMDATAKLACALALSAASFAAPPAFSAAALVLSVAASALVLRSTPREILSDLKPAAAYALLLLLATLALNASEFAEKGGSPLEILRPNAAYVPLMLGTAAALQVTALLYRSTSTAQLRESFARIERFATRREETPAADTMSLALSFLPAVARLWTRLESAWRARGGGEGPRKAVRLVPRLLHAAMREAYEKSLAMESRR